MIIKTMTAALTIIAATTGVVSSSNAKEGIVRVAVYRGPASCEDCSETMRQSIMALGPEYRVDYVGAKERIDIRDETLSKYDIYVQPGGGQDIPAAFESLGEQRVEAIRRFVKAGGGFFGSCMGAYLASGSGIGLIDDELESEVGRPGFPVNSIISTVVSTRWSGKEQTVFFQDGPYMPEPKDSSEFKKIATYQNGDIAAARYRFGKGVVVLTGPHPEADTSWFREAGISISKMPDQSLLRSVMGELHE
ncbi:BPL-N domain-containing protein [Agrobacterium sp. V1]|uniref:BPL-N domain-containing protein n=1 Tax=Agrobacterium sp. V1 TaxID=3061957 RepID=UPI0026727D94|nr:BPL-N domain-containing protein [Agrobacterium sp. V1]MDO3444415.1 BPL-N domain-containing protein [Agrobacterium sp. V1]